METIQQTMKRTELAFEAGLQKEDRKRRKIVIITLGVLLMCGWALLALYAVIGGKQSNLAYAPEAVYVPQTSAPVTGNSPSFYHSPRRGTLMYKQSAVSYQHSVNNTPVPKAAMSSTSYRVHQTSSATVHSYGGGGTSGGGSTSTYSRRSSGSGVSYAALAYSGAIYVPTKHNAVTAVGASEASDVSAQKMSVVRRAKAEFPPEENDDPGANPDPPVPLGDMPLTLLALLAAAYALRVALRRKAEIAE